MIRYPLITTILILFITTSLAYSYQINNSYSRTISSLTQTVNAISTYHIDHIYFPPPTHIPPYGLEKLTTPVSYMSNLIPDVFSKPNVEPKVDEPNSLTPFYIKRWFTALFVLIPPLVIFISLIGLYFKRKFVVKYSIITCAAWLFFYILTTPYPIADFKNHCTRYWKIWNYKDNPEIIWNGRGSSYTNDQYLSFRYNISKDGYAFLVSPGPDYYLDTDIQSIANLDKKELIKKIIVYSPTNGIHSKGDIYSVYPK